MKHLFYVQSSITYISALGVINLLDLKKENVIILFARGFMDRLCDYNKEIVPKRVAKLNHISTSGRRFGTFTLFSRVNECDKFIQNCTQHNDFTAYVPVSRNFLMQIIISNKYCKQMNYIEEGLSTYTSNFNKKYTGNYRFLLPRIKNMLNACNRSGYYNIHNNLKAESILYGLFDHELYTVKEINYLKVSLPSFHNYSVRKLNHGDSLFYFNSFHGCNKKVTSDILDVFENFIKELSTDLIYIRFHPSQSIVQQEFIIKILHRNNVRYVILNNETDAEILLLKSPKLKIYGYLSSVLFYGALWGHETFTLIDNLCGTSNSAKEFIRRYEIPNCFYKIVRKYNE